MPANDHGLTKYQRMIHGTAGERALVDIYAVLEAFTVTCPARQHAAKKILCAGIRGKGDELTDLREAAVAIARAIDMAEKRKALTEATHAK